MQLSPACPEDRPGVPLLRRVRVKRLAVFRALQVGDMLCAVPALRALRAALPDARITLVGLPWAEQFARRFRAYVDDFIAFPGHPAFPEQTPREHLTPPFYERVRAQRFDLAIQMHGSGEISNQVVRAFGAADVAGFFNGDEDLDPARFLAYPGSGPEPLRLLQLAAHLGAPADRADLEFPIEAADERELQASGLIPALRERPYLCVHPGARIRSKCWPPERFAEVADALARESGLQVVLTGSAKEADLTAAVAARMRSPAVDAAAPISLGAMAALMRNARLLVCNDTGVSHIAAGLKLPSVVIFSSADMGRWAPLDRELHRCVRDPDGAHATAVLAHARELLGMRQASGALQAVG